MKNAAGDADGDVGEVNDVGRRRREGVLDDAEDGLLLHRGELDRLQRRRLVGRLPRGVEEEARREDVALEVRRRRGQQEDDLSGEEDGEERVGGGEGEDVRLEVLVVFEGEDGRLGRECVVADEQRAVELDRVALRDVYGRGGKARSGKFKNREGQFLCRLHASSNRHAA